MRHLVSGILLIFAFSSVNVRADVPYPDMPDWWSVEDSDYGTGADFADVNGDGYLDLAISNGNDIVAAPNYVYINDNGLLPNTATWVSDDYSFSGHCEFGDVDGDGFPELMVANYISAGWQPGNVQIYDNQNGVLATTPTWVSQNSIYSFRATFGDADGDGDLDLAVATGEAYHDIYERNLIYFNNNGTLETTPGWYSTYYDASYDVQFVDIDNDRDLDLAFLAGPGPVKIHFNNDGVIETEPSWTSAASDNGNSFDFADVNDDGFFDLGVANNFQSGGTGQFKIYYSDSGVLNNVAGWSSATGGYGSEAVFCDLDNDSQEDFIGGRWWGLVQVYLNDSGQFATLPDWTTNPSFEPVIENIVFADIDNGQNVPMSLSERADGQRKLFYLGNRHLQEVSAVVADGLALPTSSYCYHLKNGWVALASAPVDSVRVQYQVSFHKDMAVSNWDGPAFIYLNDSLTPVPPEDTALVAMDLRSEVFPNPFNAHTSIRYNLPRASLVQLDIFNTDGKRIQTLVREQQTAGSQTVTWDAASAASGVYFYKLQYAGGTQTGKLTLVK